MLHPIRQRPLTLAAAMLALTTVNPAAAQSPPQPDQTPPPLEITVTADPLLAARNRIETNIGASTYDLSAAAIAAAPGAENNPLNQVILQAPGVAQDSFGQLHIRGEHNNLQYRLNGIILPEGISGFGQSLSPRFAQQVTLITGALPAEYGLRTAGIIDITTKSDSFADGGEIGIYGGSHGQIQPSLDYGISVGGVSAYISGSFNQNGLGIESPDGRSDPLHDRTQQGQGFGYFEDVINPAHKIAVILGQSRAQFQIPDSAGQQPGLGLTVEGQTRYPSQQVNENQRELSQFGILSDLHSGESYDVQSSVFVRSSSLYFTPDPLGDLLYTGIAQTAYRRDLAAGLQTEGSWHPEDDHTLRAGVIVTGDRATSDTMASVLGVNPLTGNTGTTPLLITDTGGKTAWSYSLYGQDEWQLRDDLTLNYGARFDLVDAYTHENQISPRVNLVWKASDSTVFHLGYARYFTPPPFELVGNTTVQKFANTTAAAAVTTDDTPRAETANYIDLGLSQKLSRNLRLGIDSYYKQSRNLIDEGQFGAPIILTPFNYASGRQYGVEFTASYHRGDLTGYGNFAAGVAEGKGITASQFNFTADELAYIATHYVHLDHDQTYTGSAGIAYQWNDAQFSADLIYGSGLRADSDHPNGNSLPNYTQINLGVSDTPAEATGLTLRFDIINVFDTVYEIRDGTGIGVGAPQYGPRRGFRVGFSLIGLCPPKGQRQQTPPGALAPGGV